MKPTDQNLSTAGGVFTGAQNYLPEKPTESEQPKGRTSFLLPAGMGIKPGVLAIKTTTKSATVRVIRAAHQPGVLWIFREAGRVTDTCPQSKLQLEVNDPISQQAAREVIAQLLSMEAFSGVLGVLDFEPHSDDPEQSRLALQMETAGELVSIHPPGLEDLQVGYDEQSTHYPRALWAAVWWVHGLHHLASQYRLQMAPDEVPEWGSCPDGWYLRTETGGSGPAEGDTSMLAIFTSDSNARKLEVDHPERRWRLVPSSWLPEPSIRESISADPWAALSAACRATGMAWTGPEKVRDVSHG